MKLSIKTIGSLALVAALLVGAVGTGAAALSFDSETTTSTSTSDLTDGTVVTNLDNESTYQNIQIISDNASTSTLTAPEEALELEFTVNDADSDDHGRTFYTNTSAPRVVNASAGHYAWNISNAELFDELERDVDENVTVDVTATFNASETDEESATISVHAQNGDERVVEVISDADVDDEDDVEIVTEDGWVTDYDYAALEADKDITENTTVSFVLANESVADRYTAAYDVESFDNGDYIWSMTTNVAGMPIMVFDSKQGDEIEAGWFAGGFDDKDDTYGVYKHNGGEYGANAQLDVVPQGDLADEDELEITANGNKKIGWWDAYKNFGSEAASATGFGSGSPAEI